MSNSTVYELREDADRFPGFLQVFSKDPPDRETWREDIGIRCIELGPAPFANYQPARLQFNNEGKRKKNVVGDICLSMKPFVVFSDKARAALGTFLSPVGEFLPVAAPIPGFVGYRLLSRVEGCIDLDHATYTVTDAGKVLVRKAAMYLAQVSGHDIFAVPESPTGLFVSGAFKAAVEAANLKGFDFSRPVPLA